MRTCEPLRAGASVTVYGHGVSTTGRYGVTVLLRDKGNLTAAKLWRRLPCTLSEREQRISLGCGLH